MSTKKPVRPVSQCPGDICANVRCTDAHAISRTGKDEDEDNYEAMQAVDRKRNGGGPRPPITLSEDKVMGVWTSNEQFDGKKWAIVDSDEEEEMRREAEEAEVTVAVLNYRSDGGCRLLHS